METVFITISALIFILLGLLPWNGPDAILIRFLFIIMSINGIILVLIRFGFLVKPLWIG